MKSSAEYNRLWQNKMQELPLTGDANAAWQNMQELLDKNLPVGDAVDKKPAGVPISRFITIAAILIVAAILYFAARLLLSNNHKPAKPPVGQRKLNSNNHQNRAPYESYGSRATVNTGIKTDNATGPNQVKKSITAISNENAAGGKNSAANKNKPNRRKNTNAVEAYYTGKNKAMPASSTGPVKYHNGKIIVNNRATNAAKNSGISAAGGYGVQSRKSVRYQPANGVAAVQQPGSNQTAFTNNNPGATNTPLTGSGNALAATVKTANPNGSVNNGGGAPPINSAAPPSNKTDAVAAKTKPVKAAGKPKALTNRFGRQFELGVKIGVNTSGSFTPPSQNNNFYGKSPVDAFAGISGALYITPKFSIGAAINVLSPKYVSGSSSVNNYHYVVIKDTAKAVIHNTGKLTVNTASKIYSIDIPLTFSYKLNKVISFNAGAVISLPEKQVVVKNTLDPLKNAADTVISSFLKPYVNNTDIVNKVNYSVTGGIRLSHNRFYIDANYLQNISAYPISTAFGTGKVYYHSVQFGVGYLLFKRKDKANK